MSYLKRHKQCKNFEIILIIFTIYKYQAKLDVRWSLKTLGILLHF